MITTLKHDGLTLKNYSNLNILKLLAIKNKIIDDLSKDCLFKDVHLVEKSDGIIITVNSNFAPMVSGSKLLYDFSNEDEVYKELYYIWKCYVNSIPGHELPYYSEISDYYKKKIDNCKKIYDKYTIKWKLPTINLIYCNYCNSVIPKGIEVCPVCGEPWY